MRIDRLRQLAAVLALGVLAAACSAPGQDGIDSGTSGTGGDGIGGGDMGTGGRGTGGITGSGGGGAGTGGGGGGIRGTGGKGAGGTPGAGGLKASGGAIGSGGTAAGGTGVVGTGGSSTPSDGGAPTGTTTIPGDGCTPPAAYANLFVSVSGHTQAETDTKLAAAWTKLFTPGGSGAIYFNGPGSDESYVKDLYNGDVRTEGMSYGMMAAVQLNHQTEFDRLWKWVKTHMANGTGQISWSCSPSGSKNSSGGAPDGEEYMATALIFAHNRWGDTSGKYNYATEAQWVLNVIRTQYFNANAHLVQFLANSGNTDGSYILPAFYQVWACFDTDNKAFWDASVTAARTFFHNAIDSNGVIGDRSSFTGQTTQGAGADTIRCVANIMMDHNFFNADPWQTETYATKYGAYEKGQNRYTAQMSCDSLLGFGLPAATAKPFVDKIWAAAIPNANYWDGVLYMLGMLHVSGAFHLWY